jgi:hypothetical protein
VPQAPPGGHSLALLGPSVPLYSPLGSFDDPVATEFPHCLIAAERRSLLARLFSRRGEQGWRATSANPAAAHLRDGQRRGGDCEAYPGLLQPVRVPSRAETPALRSPRGAPPAASLWSSRGPPVTLPLSARSAALAGCHRKRRRDPANPPSQLSGTRAGTRRRTRSSRHAVMVGRAARYLRIEPRIRTCHN